MTDKALKTQPCHCGSGKKYYRCCLAKDQAPRARGLTFQLEEDTLITGYALGPEGQIRLLSGDKIIPLKNVSVSEWKNIDTNPRIKSSIPIVNEDIVFDPEILVRKFDFVFGVDTNTIEINGIKFNITCITNATMQLPTSHYAGSIKQVVCVDFSDETYTAERIGWLLAVRCILNTEKNPFVKFCLCTDHDVAALGRINQRKEAIVADKFLPENITMVYAADRGSTIQNKLINSAHRAATKIGKIIQETPPQPQLILSRLLQEGIPKVRAWLPDGSEHADAYEFNR